ncbi:MAG: transcriptional coactivator p15/PC4 family protein [Enhydrobacter sp.]|nr:transcriptional coactivator p15/PC4 family protein [Enhydrobacter sp.]
MADRIIATIPSGRRGEELRVALSEFKGKTFVAVRVWYADDAGEMKPSSKGVNLKVDLLPQLAAALVEAETVARREKLLTEGA